MNVLLVHPRFPTTYWGFQYALEHIGKKASLPPLGLVTLAALLPQDWAYRLVDLNVRPLRDADLAWADVVLTGGMHLQGEGILGVIAAAHAAGKPVAVGGPSATTSPGRYAGADLVFQGEAEGREAELAAVLGALVRRKACERMQGARPTARPGLDEAPVPRFDLLERRKYASMSIQFSRGCPFSCEFCDIIEIFGRVPRVKPPERILAELAALLEIGYRGSVFLVDDNFIGNRRAVRELLPHLIAWQRERGMPFDFYTEASVNLAQDPELLRGMVEAGFTSVFLGIESPSPEALREAGKRQNAVVDLTASVDTLTRAGLEVMGGFIVGFDTDDERVFGSQRDFIGALPVPLAMVGILTALPGTALWRRLEREGRLLAESSGDQFGRPNFVPTMGERNLVQGYAGLLSDLYEPESYERRVSAFLATCRPAPGQQIRREELWIFARLVWRLGLFGPRPGMFWRLVLQALRRTPRLIPWAVTKAVMGEHLIRFTRDDVLPRLDVAAADMSAAHWRKRLSSRQDRNNRRSQPTA